MKVYFNVIKDTMKCVGAVLTIWSVAWFGFFFVLQRNVAKKDNIMKIRNKEFSMVSIWCSSYSCFGNLQNWTRRFEIMIKLLELAAVCSCCYP